MHFRLLMNVSQLLHMVSQVNNDISQNCTTHYKAKNLHPLGIPSFRYHIELGMVLLLYVHYCEYVMKISMHAMVACRRNLSPGLLSCLASALSKVFLVLEIRAVAMQFPVASPVIPFELLDTTPVTVRQRTPN